MNKLLVLLFLFSAGSVTGWVIELFFRRFLDPVESKKKKWVNPGFFVGPYLPIYGSGLIVLYLLGHISIPSLGAHHPAIGAEHPILEKLVIFVIMAACMTLIEFITGMIFINHLHLQLWDYSSYWGNIKGVICPLFSLFWYALAAFYYLVLHPQVLDALNWLSQNLAFSFFIGFFYGIFFLDIIYSFQLMIPSIVIAAVIALLVGTWLGMNRRVREVVYPVIYSISVIPAILMSPFALLLAPSFRTASLFLVVYNTIWATLFSTINGIMTIDKRYLDNAATLELTGFKRMRKVILPAASPSILSGFITSLRGSFVVLVYAEMYGAKYGMGYYVKKYAEYGLYNRAWCGFVFMVVVLVIVMQIFERVKNRLLNWTIN